MISENNDLSMPKSDKSTVLSLLAGTVIASGLSGCSGLVSYNEDHQGRSKKQVLNLLTIPIWSHDVKVTEPPPAAKAP
jgi:hypothetical protein